MTTLMTITKRRREKNIIESAIEWRTRHSRKTTFQCNYIPHNTNVNVNKCIATNVHIILHRFERGAAKKHSYKWNEQQLTELAESRFVYRRRMLLLILCEVDVVAVPVARYAGRRRITKIDSLVHCILFVSFRIAVSISLLRRTFDSFYFNLNM